MLPADTPNMFRVQVQSTPLPPPVAATEAAVPSAEFGGVLVPKTAQEAVEMHVTPSLIVAVAVRVCHRYDGRAAILVADPWWWLMAPEWVLNVGAIRRRSCQVARGDQVEHCPLRQPLDRVFGRPRSLYCLAWCGSSPSSFTMA